MWQLSRGDTGQGPSECLNGSWRLALGDLLRAPGHHPESAIGAVSSQTLLQSKLSVGRLRGKLHRYFESKVLVTYHPAYLLRNPDAKKATWQDLQLMLRDAGIDVGKKR